MSPAQAHIEELEGKLHELTLENERLKDTQIHEPADCPSKGICDLCRSRSQLQSAQDTIAKTRGAAPSEYNGLSLPCIMAKVKDERDNLRTRLERFLKLTNDPIHEGRDKRRMCITIDEKALALC